MPNWRFLLRIPPRRSLPTPRTARHPEAAPAPADVRPPFEGAPLAGATAHAQRQDANARPGTGAPPADPARHPTLGTSRPQGGLSDRPPRPSGQAPALGPASLARRRTTPLSSPAAACSRSTVRARQYRARRAGLRPARRAERINLGSLHRHPFLPGAGRQGRLAEGSGSRRAGVQPRPAMVTPPSMTIC